MEQKSMEYCMEQLMKLCSIHSPSGMTEEAADYIMAELSRLGYAPEKTRKGGVVVCLGGCEKEEKNGLFMMAHIDTLGAVVSSIKDNGRLELSPVGGLQANNCEAENCVIRTRFNGEYTGTLAACKCFRPCKRRIRGDAQELFQCGSRDRRACFLQRRGSGRLESKQGISFALILER